MPSITNKQGRYWIGTINVEHGEWNPPTVLPNNVVWLRGQQERGELEGRLHWQLFAAFNKKVRLASVKAVCGNGHWEPSRSSAAEAYVFKEDTAIPGTRYYFNFNTNFRFELGEKKFNPSSATDWAKLRDLAKAGKISECLDVAPDAAIRHYGALKHIARDFMEKPLDLESCCGIWIYGPPGVGKSHYARQNYEDLYSKMANKWWDGYQGQKSVLIDDFDLSHKVLGHHLKIWADKYSFLAESKGHASHIRPARIIITSNYKPEQVWTEDEALLEAVKRRFYFINIPLRMG